MHQSGNDGWFVKLKLFKGNLCLAKIYLEQLYCGIVSINWEIYDDL